MYYYEEQGIKTKFDYFKSKLQKIMTNEHVLKLFQTSEPK